LTKTARGTGNAEAEPGLVGDAGAVPGSGSGSGSHVRFDGPSERPLTARSVVASTLLGMQPPRLPTQILVRSGTLFGIAEGTTRVALSRMVAANELEADGDGYRLAGHLLLRQARQDVSRLGTTRPWTGDWRMATIGAEARSAGARVQLRTAMAQLRLAELREGVWLRPDNLAPDTLPAAEATVAEQCRWFAARPAADGRVLAASLWNLPAWAEHATSLRARAAALETELAAHGVDALAPAFVGAASMLRHLQADPLLPAELLPEDWPGDGLRTDHRRYDATFTTVWRDWFHAQRRSHRG
jgi:phenylacetic acid degradation operon negative regulatory protein